MFAVPATVLPSSVPAPPMPSAHHTRSPRSADRGRSPQPPSCWICDLLGDIAGCLGGGGQ